MIGNLRTNCTLKLMRGMSETAVVTGIPALVIPETRAEVLALRSEETPAGQLFLIMLDGVYDQLRQQDRLVNETTDKSYFVSSWSHFETPRASHTEVTAEAKIGNS